MKIGGARHIRADAIIWVTELNLVGTAKDVYVTVCRVPGCVGSVKWNICRCGGGEKRIVDRFAVNKGVWRYEEEGHVGVGSIQSRNRDPGGV